MGVTEDDTNLGWAETLLGELEDVFLDIVSWQLAPAGYIATVWQGWAWDTFSVGKNKIILKLYINLSLTLIKK